MISYNTYKSLAKSHQKNSHNPPSPFISITTNYSTAKSFAGQGVVATIKTKRAIPNPYNIFGEEEYLVLLVITTNEIIDINNIE